MRKKMIATEKAVRTYATLTVDSPLIVMALVRSVGCHMEVDGS